MSPSAARSKAISSTEVSPKTKPQSGDLSWKTRSVQELFSQINWESDSEPIQRVKQLSREGQSESLSLTFSVNRFFECIDWDGQRAIAPSEPLVPEPSPELEETEDEVTLEDFSSLF